MQYSSPRHIKTIQPNEILKIALRPGHHLEPTSKNTMAVVSKRRHIRGYSRATFLCNIIENDVINGTLTFNFQEPVNRDHFIATIKYQDILNAQIYLAGMAPLQKAEYPGRPGDVALGSTSFGTWQKSSELYVNVVF